MEASQKKTEKPERPKKISAEQFLDLCQTGEELDQIKHYAKKYSKVLEKRPDKYHIRGFGGIHYAAYNGNVEVFKELLPYSARLLTGEDARIIYESPELKGRIYFFNLASCSTFVHVMACSPYNGKGCYQARHIQEILMIFFEELEKQNATSKYDKSQSSYFELIGAQNSLGQNATHVSLLTGYLLEWWENSFVFRRELFQSTKDELTAPMLAAFMSRPRFMQQLSDCYQTGLEEKLAAKKKKENLDVEVWRQLLQNF